MGHRPSIQFVYGYAFEGHGFGDPRFDALLDSLPVELPVYDADGLVEAIYAAGLDLFSSTSSESVDGVVIGRKYLHAYATYTGVFEVPVIDDEAVRRFGREHDLGEPKMFLLCSYG